MSDPIVTVTVTRSAGPDGAVLVLIDTTEHFQEGSRPIRILLNDADVFADVPYLHPDDDDLREAKEVTVDVMAEQIAYY